MKTAIEWYNAGVKANSERRYDIAMECFNNALGIVPNFKEALNAKGSVFCNLGNYEEGMKCYDLAIVLDPKYTSPWNSKGILYKNLGKYDEALKCHEKALEIDPKNKTGLENLKLLQSAIESKTFIASEPSVIRRYTVRAAQSAREKYLGLPEKDYNELLLKYQEKGRKKFEDQYREEQEKFDRRISEFEQALQQKSQNQQKVFQESLQSILNAYQVRSLSSLSESLLPQLQADLQQKLGQDFSQAMEKLLQSQQYQAEILRLQQTILEKIESHQNNLTLEVMYLQDKQKQLMNENNPLVKEYQRKQGILKEQEELQAHRNVKIFYSTIEKVLGSRLMSAMSLASGMIQHAGTKTDIVENTMPNLTNVLVNTIAIGANTSGLNLIPVLNNFVTAMTGVLGETITERAINAAEDEIRDKEYKTISSGLVNLQDVMTLSELVARRLAQSYQAYIVENNLSPDEAEAAGDNTANIVYGCIKAGELNKLEGKPLEDKINYLIAKVQEEAQKQTRGFFKKAVEFKEPITASLSKADKKQVATVTEDVQALRQETELEKKQHQMEIERLKKDQRKTAVETEQLNNQVKELQKHMLLGTPTTPPRSPVPKFSLIEEDHWPQASNRLRQECVEFFKIDINLFQVNCTEKIVVITSRSNSSERALKQFGNALQKIFEDIEDVDIQSTTLKISLITTMNAKDLVSFFSQEITATAANKTPVMQPIAQFRH